MTSRPIQCVALGAAPGAMASALGDGQYLSERPLVVLPHDLPHQDTMLVAAEDNVRGIAVA
jgi:hypothetical protein